MNINELAEIADSLVNELPIREWVNDEPKNIMTDIADMLRQQTQEINNLKKQITQLSVSREPKIGDRVILIDDESEGVIVSLSIGGNAAINFDDGCYGNYTRVELITLFAYKERE